MLASMANSNERLENFISQTFPSLRGGDIIVPAWITYSVQIFPIQPPKVNHL